MKKMIYFISMVVFLFTFHSSYASSEKSKNYYLIDSIDVIINTPDDELSEFQKAIKDDFVISVERMKDQFYFEITPTELTYYSSIFPNTKKIDSNQVYFYGEHYNITQKNRGKLVELKTKRSDSCVFFDCNITFTLNKVEKNTPKLVELKEKFEQREQRFLAKIEKYKEEFSQLSLPDFIGQIYELAEGVSIKLPKEAISILSKQDSGFYTRRMGKLVINLEDKSQSIYSFSDQKNGINGELLVVPGKKEDFNMTHWLGSNTRGLIYKNEQSAVYYSNNQLEAVYYQFNEEKGLYLIGLATSKSLTGIAKGYAVLRTMDKPYQGGLVVSNDDLALSLLNFEKKYDLNLNALFDVEAMKQKIIQNINLSMVYPIYLFKKYQDNPKIKFPSESFDSKLWVGITPKPMEEHIASLEAESPKLKRLGHNLLVSPGSYSYFFEHDGVTVEILVPLDTNNLVERMAFVYVLKQLDLAKLSSLPMGENVHLFKYAEDSKMFFSKINKANLPFIEASEGLIDKKGNLVVKQLAPEVGMYEFINEAPYIVARFWERSQQAAVAGGVNHVTDKVLIIDEHGVQDNLPSMHESDIHNDLFIGYEHKGKYGLYDLKQHQWKIKPIYDQITWLNGTYVGYDVAVIKPGVTRFTSHYLLGSHGDVQIKAEGIDSLRDVGRVLMYDNDYVKIYDKQGKLLLNYKGNGIDYFASVNAYPIVRADKVTKSNLVGMVSEQGTVLIPIKYEGCYEDDNDRITCYSSNAEKKRVNVSFEGHDLREKMVKEKIGKN